MCISHLNPKIKINTYMFKKKYNEVETQYGHMGRNQIKFERKFTSWIATFELNFCFKTHESNFTISSHRWPCLLMFQLSYKDLYLLYLYNTHINNIEKICCDRATCRTIRVWDGATTPASPKASNKRFVLCCAQMSN